MPELTQRSKNCHVNHSKIYLIPFFSALYYNNGGVPSFNSSGRSSNCDEGDMQSDISLEEDVNDLNHKVIFILSKFRWSTYVLVYFSWLMDHVIYFKLRRK